MAPWWNQVCCSGRGSQSRIQRWSQRRRSGKRSWPQKTWVHLKYHDRQNKQRLISSWMKEFSWRHWRQASWASPFISWTMPLLPQKISAVKRFGKCGAKWDTLDHWPSVCGSPAWQVFLKVDEYSFDIVAS